MFANVPRHVLLSHNPVLTATKSDTRHLCLDNCSVPSLRYHEPFIPPQTRWRVSKHSRVSRRRGCLLATANDVQSGIGCLLSFCRTATPVVPRTWCRDDYALRPSCIERRTEKILLSAVVLPYSSGRRAANVVQRRFSSLSSSRLPLRLSGPSFLATRGGASR